MGLSSPALIQVQQTLRPGCIFATANPAWDARVFFTRSMLDKPFRSAIWVPELIINTGALCCRLLTQCYTLLQTVYTLLHPMKTGCLALEQFRE
jgi:hypothetical protein